MILKLKTWELTTEHAASSYGQPVLVNRATGEAYGPGDILKPYPSWGLMLATEAVKRMAATVKLTEEENALAEKFAGLVKV